MYYQNKGGHLHEDRFKRNRKKTAGSPAWRVHEHKTSISQAEFDKLLALLNASGYCPKETDFHPAQEPKAKATSTKETGLNITIPLDKVNVENLTNLLDAKGFLIKRALHIDDLRFEPKEMSSTTVTLKISSSVLENDSILERLPLIAGEPSRWYKTSKAWALLLFLSARDLRICPHQQRNL